MGELLRMHNDLAEIRRDMLGMLNGGILATYNDIESITLKRKMNVSNLKIMLKALDKHSEELKELRLKVLEYQIKLIDFHKAVRLLAINTAKDSEALKEVKKVLGE